MSLVMSSPVLIGKRYYLRVRVPKDLTKLAAGRTIHLPVDGDLRAVKVGQGVKLSLETSEPAVAKARFAEAYAALQHAWVGLRAVPSALTHKQLLGLAGELRQAFVEAFDEDPGASSLWEQVLAVNEQVRSGVRSRLKIKAGSSEGVPQDMERRFGAFLDGQLMKKAIALPDHQRVPLLRMVAQALDEAAQVNLKKAEGDYSDSGETTKYPAYVPAQPVKEAPAPSAALATTFASVIDEELRRRSAGKDGVPLRETTVKKFRVAADEFAQFRESKDVTTVTARQGDAWLRAMLDQGKLSNNTIKQRLQNLRTVVQWARQHSLGDLYPGGNPLELVKPPAYQSVASDVRTFTMAEAATVLLAARKESAPELRWLPWLAAYSGARINELAQLTPDDFFSLNGDWFFKLTTAGGKTLKTKSSERTVPVHPELIKEGFLDFLGGLKGKASERMFPKRSQPNISEWVRGRVGLTREGMAPNHGWRHLFEDQCMSGGVSDAARTYITGRATGKSAQGYGKSQAMLPGLAMEMTKVPTIPLGGRS